MLLTKRGWCICWVLTMLTAVLPQQDLVNTLANTVATLFAGFGLTSLYLISFGTDYPPIDQDVTFWCVTPNGKQLVQTYLNDPKIREKLDFGYPINFVIHGWLSGLDGGNLYLPREVRQSDGWMRSTSLTWVQVVMCNVCAVDWSRLANYEYSVAALVNTPKVAYFLMDFIDFLKTKGLIVSQSAIAGHSLGAQIASKVGRYYQGMLDAIYGADPAGPGFTFPWDFGAGTRLVKTDARYVQCIHTSRGTLGTLKDCGHADFVLNDGFVQPGCLSVFCSHSRAHDYFDESLLRQNIFSGDQCKGTFMNVVEGLFGMQCSSDTDRLGIYTQRKPGSFFVKTNSKSPFALNAGAVSAADFSLAENIAIN